MATSFNGEDLTHSNSQNNESIITEADTLKEDTKGTHDLREKIDQFLNDVRYWKKERDKLDGLVKDMEKLDTFRRRVDKALDDTEMHLDLVRICVAWRERQVDFLQLHDDVQTEMLKGLQVIERAETLLNRTKEQLLNLRNTVTLEDWHEFNSSSFQAIRSSTKSLLKQIRNEMRNQVNNIKVAVANSIAECEDTKIKLEDNLSRVTAEIKEQEKNIETIKMSIEACQAALTRLKVQQDMPNVELCRDPTQDKQIEELKEIVNAGNQLIARWQDAHLSLSRLRGNELELMEDVDKNVLYLVNGQSGCKAMTDTILFLLDSFSFV